MRKWPVCSWPALTGDVLQSGATWVHALVPAHTWLLASMADQTGTRCDTKPCHVPVKYTAWLSPVCLSWVWLGGLSSTCQCDVDLCYPCSLLRVSTDLSCAAADAQSALGTMRRKKRRRCCRAVTCSMPHVCKSGLNAPGSARCAKMTWRRRCSCRRAGAQNETPWIEMQWMHMWVSHCTA